MNDCFFVIGSAKVDRKRKKFGTYNWYQSSQVVVGGAVGKYSRTQCGKASRLDALTFKIQSAYVPVLPVFKTAKRDERHGTRNTSKDKRIDVETSRHFTIACHEHPLPE